MVPKTKVASSYPGLYLFTSMGRMMRTVVNLKHNAIEYIGMYAYIIYTCVVFMKDNSQLRLLVAQINKLDL